MESSAQTCSALERREIKTKLVAGMYPLDCIVGAVKVNLKIK